jgi:UMP-CMP kinase
MSSEKVNTYYITVSGSGSPEVDGLYVPTTAPPKVSESGNTSSLGYWNNKMAWDRADGKAERNPSLSYSDTYKAWRLARLDGHLAYTIVTDDELPSCDVVWDVYKKGVAPAPKIEVHTSDPREKKGEKLNVVFVLGGPGAGKGTMCELASLQLGWTHYSAGDLLRAERQSGSANAALIESIIQGGGLVPSTITVGLIKKAMVESGKTNFLIDGFPRSVENWEAWKEVFGEDVEMPVMLFFECPLPILEERILARGKFSGRSDDNVDSLRLRFNTYKNETMPIVEVFRAVDGKCIEVDSSQSREEVWKATVGALTPFTDSKMLETPLTEKSEMLLGLRPYPKKAKAADA